MNTCMNCESETSNAKFCSKSCAATFNGKKFPKRKASSEMIDCASNCGRKILKRLRRKHCDDCRCTSSFWGRLNGDVQNLTLLEFRQRYNRLERRTDAKNSPIRYFCHRFNIDLKKQTQCQVCGYSLHVQLCHIKPIHKFDDSATLQEVNHPSNIAILCPNHHWELDHGFLSPDQIPVRE